MIDSDGRECARANRCATSWVDETGTRRGAWGPRVLCEADRARLLRDLAELPELYAWLWMQLPIGQSPADARGGRRTGAAIPLRTDVDALMREIIDALAGWDERVRAVARLRVTDTGPHAGGRALTRMVRVLTAHVDVLLALRAETMVRPTAAGDGHELVELGGADAALELAALTARARSRAGLTRKVTPLQGVTCPGCDLITLVRMAGEDYPFCQSCGLALTDDDYRRWTAHQAGELEAHGS